MEQILAEVAAMPLSIRRQTAKKSIAPHEAIVLKGDDADHVFILLKGDVRVLNEFSSGQRYSFAEYSAPSFIGEYEVMAEQSVYATTNEAITRCELISMRAEVFIEWVQGSASLAFLLARIIAEKSYPTSNENGRIKFLPGLQKLQSYLLKRYDAFAPVPFILREDRQQIADEIGTSIKTVNRSVTSLKEENLIGLLHGKITITPEQYTSLQRAFQNAL